MNFLLVVDIMGSLSMIAVFPKRNRLRGLQTAMLPGFVVDELA